MKYFYIGAFITHLCRDHTEWILYVSVERRQNDGLVIEYNSILLLFIQKLHCDLLLYPSDNYSGDTTADSKDMFVYPKQLPVWTHIHGTPQLDNNQAGKPINTMDCDILDLEIDLLPLHPCQEEY